MDFLLNGGVLMIGSLIWDSDDLRTNWRNNNLQTDRLIVVPAPIRYGRISKERNCTFTMVFSNECNQPEMHGDGIFVPFKDNPINLSNLKIQSQDLIKAERKKPKLDSERFNWNWGALTISVNPKILIETSEKNNQAISLLKFWSKNYNSEFNPEQYKVGQELPILNSQGILKFNWPDELNDFDFIIATATQPAHEFYPTSQNIADRMLASRYDEYFIKNREFGISTFQDEEIGQVLAENRFTEQK